MTTRSFRLDLRISLKALDIGNPIALDVTMILIMHMYFSVWSIVIW